MSDMTDAQRKAARKALASFPSVKIEITRGEGEAQLTPYLAATPTTRGTPVNVVYGATSASEIEKNLMASCHAIVES